MVPATNFKTWLLRATIAAWVLQGIYLAWHFAPEVQDLAWRIPQRSVGAAMRQEDPLYRWCVTLAGLIPPGATYVFLDDYEAGKEIQVRYFLAPRRHILLPPDVPVDFLFYALHQEKAGFLIIRDRERPLEPGVKTAVKSPALKPLAAPGPGLAYRVDQERLQWGFYD